VSGIWAEYVSILTDPAHSLVEFTFVAVDYLIVQTAVHALKRHFHRDIETEHRRLDREHGVSHPGEGTMHELVLRDGVLWYGQTRVGTLDRVEHVTDATDPYIRPYYGAKTTPSKESTS